MNTLNRLVRVWTAAAFALAACAAQAQTGFMQLQGPDLPITVVYPTDAKESAQTLGLASVQVALGASPKRGNGRLIVLSHGTGGDAMSSHDLARTLVAAGFVVAQPEHRGDNWRDQTLAGPEAWKSRPGEVSQAIDALMRDPRFAAILDTSKVGVHGMSAGGGTALTLAGGQWSLGQLLRHCAAHMNQDPGFCFLGLRTPAEREERAALFASGKLPPGADTLLGGPQARDPRIAAVAVVVPVSAMFTSESLANITLPVGVVEATADQMLIPAFHSNRVLALCKACQSLGALQGAAHLDVLSPWPDAIAQRMAQMTGGALNPSFDRTQRPASYQRVAEFFTQNLK